MALTLVLGPANSAKAGRVLGAYAQAARRDALLVVPTTPDADHYDRELAEQGVTLGRALTFPRLLDELARRAVYNQPRLTPLQRERLLRRIVTALELPTLQESKRAPRFAAAAGRMLTELRPGRAPAP